MKIREFNTEVEMSLDSGTYQGYINIEYARPISDKDTVNLAVSLSEGFDRSQINLADFDYGVPKVDMIKFLEASLKMLKGE